VQRLLRLRGREPVPTRFRLEIVVGRKSTRTRRNQSPVVVPRSVSTAEGVGTAAAPCGTGGDWDGDLLSNDLELRLGLDPCAKDSDGDGVEDGYEQKSAMDLNHYPRTLPLPYPGKRPYPNALDPTDAGTDYDGDDLTLREEYTVWVRCAGDGVRRRGRPTTLGHLLYSDGLQKSIDPAPFAPSQPLADWALDMNGDDRLRDDERDADGDGLGNWDEARGRFTEAWWPAEHNGQIEPRESRYPQINFLDNGDLARHDAYANRDLDGDGVLDGADDSDHDGLSNQFEVRRPADWENDAIDSGTNPWAYVNPFNPCKPFSSERCHRHPPLGYYDNDEEPPIGPGPPAGYPGSHPATPDG
jgi:hypothetical protein